PDTGDSYAFLLACFFVGIYFITTFDLVSNYVRFIRLYILAHILFPAAAVHLSGVFPEKRPWIARHRYLQFIPYVVSIMLLIPVEIFYPGPLSISIYYRTIPLYMAVSAAAIVFSTLAAYFQRASMVARLRARVVLLGAGL